MTSVLGGVRVLDFGRYIAGPYCGALLADLGAEVIRVEKVTGSEDRYVNPMADGDGGGMYLQCNRNKLGIAINPKSAVGKDIVRRLVTTADVVVANLPPAELRSMGIDYETLRLTKPDIILTTVSAYGQGGPYSHRIGFDGIGQVMSGLAYLSGPTNGPPMRFNGAWVDFLTAMACLSGTLAALLHRRQTGEGQLVEGALLKSALTVAGGTLIEQSLLGPNRVREGNRGQTTAPSDIVKTKDGQWVLVSVIGDPQFKRWCRLVGAPEWVNDDRFRTDRLRSNHRAILCGRLADWASLLTKDEMLAQLDDAKVVGATVLSPQQALDDPHINAIGFLQPLNYPGLTQPARIPKTLFDLGVSPGRVLHRAPVLGEHTTVVLQSLGYTAAEVAQLERDKEIRSQPQPAKL